MSNIDPHLRRPLSQVQREAASLRLLFPASCFHRWEVAGSVRRRESTVGDCEHVIIPRHEGGLFGDSHNLLWEQAAKLVEQGQLHPGRTWGERSREVIYMGLRHQLYSATPDNWGAILAIRTGPWELSRTLVIRLRQRGYRQFDGQLWHVAPPGNPAPGSPAPGPGSPGSRHGPASYTPPEGGALEFPGQEPDPSIALGHSIVPVPDEETYFRLAGMTYCEPHKRGMQQ